MARLKVPSFDDGSRLLRYVHQADRLKHGRAAITAFEADHLLQKLSAEERAKSHLSVNSLEVESGKAIAAYHRLNWQGNRGKVAILEHKVWEYVKAAEEASAPLVRKDESWEFTDLSKKTAPAFKHRPVPPNDKNDLGSASHCGVEFVRLFDEFQSNKFARRLVNRKFHLR